MSTSISCTNFGDCRVADNGQQLQRINWTVYGRMASITKTGVQGLTFGYDAGGHRITKTATAADGTGVNTYYVRDAQGNVLAVYQYKTNASGGVTEGDWLEQHLYGNSRLGMLQPHVVIPASQPLTSDGYPYNTSNNPDPSLATGNRLYELTNHLGNVVTTINDITTNGVVIEGGDEYFSVIQPTVISQQDYYPFGMEISGNLSAPKNEYLYNKKELQEELSEYDYGARFYDPILGRWNVVDAYAEHPDQIDLSPYAYVGNNPITRIDPDGNCPPCDVPADDGVFDRYIRPTTDGDRMQNPTKAAIHSASIAVLDFIGIRGLINAVGHLGDKNVPVHAKVASVVGAMLNVMPVDGEGAGAGEGIHKNSNDYVGHQGVYEIKVDGELEKYGKSDMTKTSKKTGEPVRLQSQLNKIQKAKPAADVQGKVIYEHKNISTKEIKQVTKHI